ncbi:NlpC/P60 family protein [Ilyomonas limi]|uniref:NlpC/P60 family protein n=1 Tax=Ilyomonas limi TaxID=2575867 RepID=A0A4U3LB05_9BACT|nr:C40 family peptidase [Ilyomonas limi]TKK70987.1 NlpC/P60 family protein [Ilyomonas limi]
MQYVVAIVAVCPLRSEASHRSEMVSQLLFGEGAEVLEAGKDFTKVKCLYDGYEAWAQTSQLAEVDEEIAKAVPVGYTFKRNTIVALNDAPMHVPLATPVFRNTFFGKYKVEYTDEETVLFDASFYTEEVIRMVALLYENVPYLWGGKSSFGIDCSGFVQQVFKLFGKHLLRDTYQQAAQGGSIGFLQEVQCGDLAFFDNAEGRIVHVGILLNSEEIIHASGNVRVDTMDSYGIINRNTGLRTHQLRVIKRG